MSASSRWGSGDMVLRTVSCHVWPLMALLPKRQRNEQWLGVRALGHREWGEQAGQVLFLWPCGCALLSPISERRGQAPWPGGRGSPGEVGV